MKSAALFAGAVSLALVACKDVPQAPPDVVPPPPPATTIVIDSQFYADYAYAITYPSLVVSGPTTFGLTYRLWEAGLYRFAGCPIDCENRRNWVVGDADTAADDRAEYNAATTSDDRMQTAYQLWPSGATAVLKYASCVALCQHMANWSTTNVDTTAQTGFFVSLAARPGQTHIAYLTLAGNSQQTQTGLHYARCSSDCLTMNAWTTTRVDSAAYGDTQIAVDPADVVHIVYTVPDPSDPFFLRLKYARCATGCSSTSNWQMFMIGPGHLPSLAVDAGANLTLAYVVDGRPAHVATCATGCPAGAWQGGAVVDVPEGKFVYDVSLVPAASGRTYLAYGTTVTDSGTNGYSTNYGIVRLGRCDVTCSDSSNWRFMTVDSTATTSPYFVSLALDSAGHAAIVHASSAFVRFSLVKQLPWE